MTASQRPPLEIVVGIPGLVVLVGAAGSGKSTLAGTLFEPSEILSSDAYREAVSGDAADQRATRLVFSILHREVRRRLAAERLVVVDATNLERGARLGLLRIARATGVDSVAIVVRPRPETVHARNAGRVERIVPAAVVERHLVAMGRLGADEPAIRSLLMAEGFVSVHVVEPNDARTPIGATADRIGGRDVALVRRPRPA